MGVNAFEDSRVAAGKLNRHGQKSGIQSDPSIEDSTAMSRDDVRDGVEGLPGNSDKSRPAAETSRLLAASTLVGDPVRNRAGPDLGTIEEIMLDLPSGRIAFAVLSFGGVLGIGTRLFAVECTANRHR
jgi:hypothetical protein